MWEHHRGLAAAIVLGLGLGLGLGLAIVGGAPATAGATNDDPSADALTQLVETYSPVIVVRTQATACGDGEAYLPMPVDPLFGRPGMVLRGPAGATVESPTADDLASATSDAWYLDTPGNALRPGCTYERLYDEMVDDGVATPTVYARVATDPERPDHLVLQYWMYYLYNDWNDRHEGDWEMVQLVFDVADVASALRSSPTLVVYAQHEGGEMSEWSDDVLRTDGSHPLVFVGEGSHASYFTDEHWFGKSAQSGFGCDNTQGPSTPVTPAIILLDDAAPPSWLAFEGHWGERRPSFNNGPTGPTTKASWSAPVRWVEDEGRRGAVSLPAGGSRVTDFFCAAVERGSLVMFRTLDQPAVVLGGAVLSLVVVFVLLRRTAWRPVLVEPIAQRRRFGQVLRTALKVVRQRPAWFASLGVVLVAAGAVASVLQSVLLRTTELGDLADVADRDSAWGAFVGIAVGLIVVVPATGAVTLAVSEAVLRFDEPRRPSRRVLLRNAIRRPRAIAMQFVVGAVVVVGGLSVVLLPPALWLASRWAVAMPAAADGQHPAVRSAALTKGHQIRSLALLAWNVLLVSVVPAAVGVVALLVTESSFVVVNLVAAVVALVTVPTASVSSTLQYLDLKVAAESAGVVG